MIMEKITDNILPTIVDYSFLDQILKKHDYNSYAVVSILQEVQKEYRYLPEQIFAYIAKELDVSEAKLFSVATFYENFSLQPKGKYIIKICDGTACHVRKSMDILNVLYSELGLSAQKHTTEDLGFTVETVSCLGACGLAPVITVNEKVYGSLTTDKAKEIIADLKQQLKQEAKEANPHD